MAWQPDRVVVIGRREAGEIKLIGSGALVASERVLTARHVVLDKTGAPKPSLVVKREQTNAWETNAWEDATVLWSGDAALDLAVLDCKPMKLVQGHPLTLFDGHTIADQTPWHARGFPMVSDEPTQRALESLNGSTHAFWAHEKELRLNVLSPPAVCKGLSGAAVIVRDRVVGVVRAVPDPASWDRKLLEATPIAVALGQPKFLDAMGVRPGHDLLRERVERVVDKVADKLAERPEVMKKIVRKLCDVATPPDAQSVARVLVEKPLARTVAKALNDLDEDFEEDGKPADCDVIRELFWLLLRFAVDWQPLQALHCGTFADDSATRGVPVSVELPYNTMTVSEVILAGLDDRMPRFKRVGEKSPLLGATMLRVPATESAPFFKMGGRRMAGEVVKHLAMEFGDDDYPGARAGTEEDQAVARRRYVEHELRFRTYECRRKDRAPWYLMVNAKDLAAGGDAQGAWSVLVQSLHEELPSLRVVWMTKNDFDEGDFVAKHIDAMHKHSTMKDRVRG